MIRCPSPSRCPWVNPEAAFGCAGSGLRCWWHSSTPLLESWLPLGLCAPSSSIRAHTMSSPTLTERTLDSKLNSTQPQQVRQQSISFLHNSRREDWLLHSVCGDVMQSSRVSSWLAKCRGQAKKVKSVPNNMQGTCLSPPCVCSFSGLLWGKGGCRVHATCDSAPPSLCSTSSCCAAHNKTTTSRLCTMLCPKHFKINPECVGRQQCERLPLQLGCTKSNHLYLSRSE